MDWISFAAKRQILDAGSARRASKGLEHLNTMLRWNPRLSVAVIALFPLLVSMIGSAESNAQTADSVNPDNYYSRPDLKSPPASIQQKDSEDYSQKDYIKQQYNELLSSVRPTARDYIYPGSYMIDRPGENKYVPRKMPDRLVPPGRSRASDQAQSQPVRSTASIQQRSPSSVAIRENKNDPQQKYAQPDFKLPPIVKPEDLPQQRFGADKHASAKDYPNSAGDFGAELHEPVTSPSVRYPIVPVVEGSSRIPSQFSNRDTNVTRATIISVDNPLKSGVQTVDRQTTSNDQGISGPSNNPFQDPADVEPRQDPFADPPDDLMPQDKQDPFADPPPDMDPNRVQDPFRDPESQQPVDPFANSPQNIVPPKGFEMPDERVEPGEFIDPGQAPADQRVREPAQVLGPFRQPAFQRSPLLAAPEYREFQGAEPSQYLPGAIQEYYPESYFENHDPQQPADYHPPHRQAAAHYADQPTLMRHGHTRFHKKNLYEGISQSVDGQSFPAYECSPCDPGISDKRAFGCLGKCSPCGFGCGTGAGGCNSCCDPCCSCCCEPMFYVSVFGGFTGLQDSSPLFFPGTASPQFGYLNYDDGFGFGTALGQIQGENLRTELEFCYRRNSASSLVINGGPFAIDGNTESFSGMFNGYWDFRERLAYWCLRPYIGGGVGFAFLNFNLSNLDVPVVSDGYRNDSAFAWQLMGGVSRRLTRCVDGFVEYRYFSAQSVRVNLDPFAVGGKVNYDTNNVFFGLRMNF